MKISIKTIKGEVFPIEIEPSNTILDLKKKIEGVKNMEVSTQKLILKGANTNDENTLESYGVKEGDFLVVMQTKKLPSAQSQPQQNVQPQPLQTQPKTNTTAPQTQPQTQQTASNPGPAQDFTQSSASNVVLGDKFNQTVDEICRMGFSKEDAVRALKAAFNNPDRAIDYLINGIPDIPADHHQPPAHQIPPPGHHQPAHNQPPVQGAGGLGVGGQPNLGGAGSNSESSEAFLQLLSNPSFQSIRNLLRQQPAMVPNLLMGLQQTNPEIYNLIMQNQEAFNRWLQGDESAQRNVLYVTPEEKEAITRLEALGFDKQAVVQAYLACDKNEELAANLLFDQMNQGDFDDQPLRVGGAGAGVQGLGNPLQQPQSHTQPQQPAGQNVPPQQQPPVQGNVEQKPEEKKPEEQKPEEKKPEEQKQPEGEKKEEGHDNKDKKNDKDDDDTIFS